MDQQVSIISRILEISEIRFFVIFTKRRAPNFHAPWSGFHAEISHIRPIQGQKLKLFEVLISYCFLYYFHILGIWYLIYAKYGNGFHNFSRI